MDNLELNEEFFKNRKLKSFIRVGQTFIDIKQTIGFSFINDPDGYIIIQFVYDSGRGLNAFLRDRNDFSQFLLELDPFIDDPNALVSIDSFIDEIEKDFGIDKPKKTRRARNKKQNKNKEVQNFGFYTSLIIYNELLFINVISLSTFIC